MKRFLPIFIILFISCSYGADEELESGLIDTVQESTYAITETSFKYIDLSLIHI